MTKKLTNYSSKNILKSERAPLEKKGKPTKAHRQKANKMTTLKTKISSCALQVGQPQPLTKTELDAKVRQTLLPKVSPYNATKSFPKKDDPKRKSTYFSSAKLLEANLKSSMEESSQSYMRVEAAYKSLKKNTLSRI